MPRKSNSSIRAQQKQAKEARRAKRRGGGAPRSSEGVKASAAEPRIFASPSMVHGRVPTRYVSDIEMSPDLIARLGLDAAHWH